MVPAFHLRFGDGDAALDLFVGILAAFPQPLPQHLHRGRQNKYGGGFGEKAFDVHRAVHLNNQHHGFFQRQQAGDFAFERAVVVFAIAHVFDEFVLRLQKDAGLITFDTILTDDDRMKKAIEQAKILATLPNPVLIYGETGTGKELFVQSMINYSGVPKNKVVIQNCAAVPDNLMESILFGTVRGVYTGAETRKGLFEEADGGVLFLDEISSIPYTVQAKLLRVIQDGTFRPLGAANDKQVNVKIIGAMNVDPIKAIEDGTFRSDLFYRFSSGFISLVPLRERKEDIRLFIDYYVDYFAQVYGKDITGVDPAVKDIFMNSPWEGNVRELRNVIESMVVTSKDKRIMDITDIPEYFLHEMDHGGMMPEETEIIPSDREDRRLTYHELMDRYEEKLIRNALEEAGGNVSRAGEILDIPRETLRYRMKKLGL